MLPLATSVLLIAFLNDKKQARLLITFTHSIDDKNFETSIVMLQICITIDSTII
jgi:hypothetical protein